MKLYFCFETLYEWFKIPQDCLSFAKRQVRFLVDISEDIVAEEGTVLEFGEGFSWQFGSKSDVCKTQEELYDIAYKFILGVV